MALGEFKLFQMKSKKQRDKEEKEYAAWAFPYGDTQREKLTSLMTELVPKALISLSLASFLTCKELYENTLEESETRENAVNHMINVTKSYNQLIKKDEMPLYLALVLADADIDENCEYPPADEIRERIQKLNDLRIAKKSGFLKKKK